MQLGTLFKFNYKHTHNGEFFEGKFSWFSWIRARPQESLHNIYCSMVLDDHPRNFLLLKLSIHEKFTPQTFSSIWYSIHGMKLILNIHGWVGTPLGPFMLTSKLTSTWYECGMWWCYHIRQIISCSVQATWTSWPEGIKHMTCGFTCRNSM